MRWCLLFWLFLVMVLAGCASDKAFLAASDARYHAIAPRQERYLRADETLSDDERESGLDTLRTWAYDLEGHGRKLTYKVADDNDRR